MKARRRNCDVLIIGAGPVGALLACVMARAGHQVVLAERGRRKADPGHSRDTRGYALSAGSVTILDDLGYWAPLMEHAEAIKEIHVSRRSGFGGVVMDASSHGVAALGQVVPAARIEAMLATALAATDAQLLEQTRLEQLEAAADGRRGVVIAGPDGRHRVAARLVVAADGSSSETRSAAGIEVLRRRYDADALVFDIEPSRPHRGRAFERFTPEGPLALLPQSGGRMNVVWVAPPEACAARLSLGEVDRVKALQRAFGWRLGRLRAVGPVACFPLEMVRARRLHDQRLVLAGNVAHGLHPVAGQGLNLSLRDLAVLAGLLSRASDPGIPELLSAYSRARASDIERVATATDFLARGLLADRGLLPHALGGAMLLLDRVDPLRRAWAAQAMGLQPLPRQSLRAIPTLSPKPSARPGQS